jgi:hypothetical protein
MTQSDSKLQYIFAMKIETFENVKLHYRFKMDCGFVRCELKKIKIKKSKIKLTKEIGKNEIYEFSALFLRWVTCNGKPIIWPL